MFSRREDNNPEFLFQSAHARARGTGVKGSDLKSDPSKLIEEPEGSAPFRRAYGSLRT